MGISEQLEARQAIGAVKGARIMRYVGIDPSTKTGLAIIDKQGNIINVEEISSKQKADPHRFVDIAMTIVDNLEPNDVVTIEGFSYGSKGKGVSTQYGLGWIIRYFLFERGYKYTEVPPTSVKKFATGKGNTKKDEMVLPIYKKWGFEHSSDNVRDAFVLAQMAKGIYDTSTLLEYEKEALKKVIG
jgi:crossover junction endodeoxyribonuclease RuvC